MDNDVIYYIFAYKTYSSKTMLQMLIIDSESILGFIYLSQPVKPESFLIPY
jgi:hypothetical protein